MKRKAAEKNKYRRYLTAVALLGVTAAISLQPLTVQAGPSSEKAGTRKAGPASDDTHSSTMNAGGPGSSQSSGSSYSGNIKLPLKPAEGYGASAVVGGLGTFIPFEEEAAGAIARGIDVSYWNQNIDWKQAAADNVQFAMLATRFRGEEDPFFSVNADAASKAGIRLGAYIYSYATSAAMAEQEADFVLDLIKDYPISFPVVFDAEDMGTLGTLSPVEITNVINTFCRRIEAAGYYPMVYANEYWLNNMIDMSNLNYDVWVARYQERFTYENPAMWQASNTGSVNGINGNVDINYLYKDYTQTIPGNTWRNIGGKYYYYKDHVMQRNAWIHDGTNWYYMSGEGNPSTGWLNQNGTWYYLDRDGKMLTGWQEIGGVRYLLGADGAMATGWREESGGLYYFDTTGALVKNAELEYNGVRYMANADGSCTVIPEPVEAEVPLESGDTTVTLPEEMPEGADLTAIQGGTSTPAVSTPSGSEGTAASQTPSGPAGR